MKLNNVSDTTRTKINGAWNIDAMPKKMEGNSFLANYESQDHDYHLLDTP